MFDCQAVKKIQIHAYKCARICLAARLCPDSDSLGELKRSTNPIAAMIGLLLREERRGNGRVGRKKKGRGGEGSLHLNNAASCLTVLCNTFFVKDKYGMHT